MPTPSVEQPTSFAGGRYEVARFLGEGGKKRVYLAHDALLDRDVAFALIKTDGLDEVGRERITREAQAMGRLGAHPHIVSIFDLGEDEGPPFVVTELMGGGDVEGLLEDADGPLPLEQSLAIANGVARGLVFAHGKGVVHRDLKPGNVLAHRGRRREDRRLRPRGGLDQSRLTMHGMMVGTVAYMPPEQALGGEVTPQADLYSLGAMLYELVTGQPPFAGGEATAVISQHINTPPVAPSWLTEHCPRRARGADPALLAKAPQDRPASAAEVLARSRQIDPTHAGVRRRLGANPLDRLARGVFVGRERELERLRGAFDEAFAGRGSVVMLVGEPGIGKTRTAQELATLRADARRRRCCGAAHASRRARRRTGRGSRSAARGKRDNDLGEGSGWAAGDGPTLVPMFPALRRLFPDLPEPPVLHDAEAAQFRLFDAYTDFVGAVADPPALVISRRPALGGQPTLLLLSIWRGSSARMRVLVVGTYRDTDLDRTHPLSEALAELNREPGSCAYRCAG